MPKKLTLTHKNAITALLCAVLAQLVQLQRDAASLVPNDDIDAANALINAFARTADVLKLQSNITQQDSFVRDKYYAVLLYIDNNKLSKRITTR